ncbi:MAG: DUF4258 domain-containing protein [Candidatus Omnitrophica bacterium]|nr:DUF4258 domain-containing protein [Candidatus Omnitrophota bacterium]
MKPPSKDLLFEAETPLGFRVCVTKSYWDFIVRVKHPVMAGHEKDVRNTLEHPEEIRRSKADPSVYLFYKTQRKGRWVCAVSKAVKEEGFLITAYPTDTIKTGEKIWPR